MRSSVRKLSSHARQLRMCSSGAKTTHFGNRTVGEDEKEHLVGGVFKSVAGNYDVMNDLMSAGIHRCWKDRMISLLDPQPGKQYLDVAGGTGDISFRIIDAINQSMLKKPPNSTSDSKLVISDINASMLEEGKKRFHAKYHNLTSTDVEFVEANAEKLPFDDNSFDGYTIAFGIRNVTHIDVALTEAFRVLKPGGHLLVLEFSKVENPLLETLYDTYSYNVIPAIGHVVAGDWNSYQYLVESIRKFPPQEQFATMIREAGFKGVSYESQTFGVTAIHSGWKIA
eukprot:TRINITY_DN15720_c0_g1_i1.p1 TRINITY_DN15720_c0_g1~~TRINITY_DN15720_c0_g1_i1.p1  ORF type:complete len:283 (+),score=46.43 TRINITY_DN15720_c0_g1_i1:76-924(+)